MIGVGALHTIAVGHVDGSLMETVETALDRTFGFPVQRMTPLPPPAYALDASRGQHSSVAILRELVRAVPKECIRLIAVTECDLFIPMLSFVFGQAQLDGRIALVSCARLKQDFYGLPPQPALVMSRLVKEVMHEAGHTFGLVHCARASCPMSLSTGIRQVDRKGAEFCEGCERVLRPSLLRYRGFVLSERS